ncbi:DUF1214 domain-containing protein [Microbulbifer sp. Q7]|uniref:DUF1214 domain-containing protein n=1 Tax=Microbulbifer sp. Q7 TaxID=1785091 RepID=UPI00082DF120|nr:DUF1214 domain-containing protein [Microbulbifer sp. Q7]
MGNLMQILRHRPPHYFTLMLLGTLISGIGLTGCGSDHERNAPSEQSQHTTEVSQEVSQEASQQANGTASGAQTNTEGPDVAMSDTFIQDLVTRSYPYVALYNVNNKFAAKQGGWNTCSADTQLKDHTTREIARPNNDTLYISCLLDLRTEPVILKIPAFDSDYASLMITAYDHYVNVPLSTRAGDFKKPLTLLLYSARTKNYDGAPVEGVDKVFEASGDFVSAVFRVMPHSQDKDRFGKILEQMKSVTPAPLNTFLGKPAIPAEPMNFPAVGETDVAVFGDNLFEVMQFVFNHTTFDPDNPEDQSVLTLYKHFGIAPGNTFDPDKVANVDKIRIRDVAERIQKKGLASSADDALMARIQPKMFQPKGQTDLETLLTVSIFGPIGLPMEEAVYPSITTADGKPMNAMHDYVLRMSVDELPPAGAFWSLTLYDLKDGFFIPNERKKYSVGQNAGMKLDDDGGITIYIAKDKPDGVPEENWLPIERKDLDLSLTMRIYVPDLKKYANWTAPKVERIDQ